MNHGLGIVANHQGALVHHHSPLVKHQRTMNEPPALPRVAGRNSPVVMSCKRTPMRLMGAENLSRRVCWMITVGGWERLANDDGHADG